MLKNRYLMDRTMRRGMNDGRRYGRGRDRAMDYEHDYPKRDSRSYDRNMSDYRGQDYHRGYEQYGQHRRPMEYEMYGIGGFRPRMNDYNDYGYDYARGGRRRNDYNDYGYDERDYAEMDNEWKEHLEKWCKELKQHDRFGMPKDQVIQNAKQMGVQFDKYDEKEFLTTFYMVMSDYPRIANEPHTYLAMAKDWLEDDDSKLKGSEKLCAYYYEVVKGGED